MKLERGAIGEIADPEGGRHGRQDKPGIGDPGQRDERGSIGCSRRHLTRRLQGKPRLTDATGAGKRNQAVPRIRPNNVDERGDVTLAPDQRVEWRGELARGQLDAGGGSCPKRDELSRRRD